MDEQRMPDGGRRGRRPLAVVTALSVAIVAASVAGLVLPDEQPAATSAAPAAGPQDGTAWAPGHGDPNGRTVADGPPVEREPAAPRVQRRTLAQAKAEADALDRPLTIVSLTFDDALASQRAAIRELDALGLQGTFYVPTGLVDGLRSLRYDEIVALQAAGHEIGGHTANHADLLAVDEPEARRQICDDRSTLLDWGFEVRSFAYPFARSDAGTERIAQECGYDSARMLGGLRSHEGCDDCPAAGPLRPDDPFHLLAPAQVESDWTLEDLQGMVLRAEETGGWLPITFHNVCARSCEINVTPELFSRFATWLAARRQTMGTAVLPVGDVIGGTVQPGVGGPADPPTTAANAIRNPGFTERQGDLPACWMAGGYGRNRAQLDLVAPGRDGGTAGRVRMSDYRRGDAKWLPRLDLGQCAPSAEPGGRYRLGAWYTASVATQFAVYLRDDHGAWRYWTTSPWFPASDAYAEATWTTPEVPEGYEAISFGMSIFHDGALAVDDVSLERQPSG